MTEADQQLRQVEIKIGPLEEENRALLARTAGGPLRGESPVASGHFANAVSVAEVASHSDRRCQPVAGRIAAIHFRPHHNNECGA